MRFLKPSFALLASLVVSSPLAFCDIVTLKNGDTLEGVVISQENNLVVLRIPGGELGFDAKLVESIDTTKGLNKDQLAKAEDEQKKASEAAVNERLAELRARRAAVRASEASAVLDRGTAVDASASRDAAPQPTEEERVQADAESRLDAIEAVLATVPTARERVQVRRALFAYYFGSGVYLPNVLNSRSNVVPAGNPNFGVGTPTPKASTAASK